MHEVDLADQYIKKLNGTKLICLLKLTSKLLVRFSNDLGLQTAKQWFGSTDVKVMVNHSKTEPFVNRTHLDHSKTGLV